MNTANTSTTSSSTEVADALDRAARALHDAAIALRGTNPGFGTSSAANATPATTSNNVISTSSTTGTNEVCPCGGALVYAEWTSKAGRPCRAWRCERSRVGEDHTIRWV